MASHLPSGPSSCRRRGQSDIRTNGLSVHPYTAFDGRASPSPFTRRPGSVPQEAGIPQWLLTPVRGDANEKPKRREETNLVEEGPCRVIYRVIEIGDKRTLES